ncbi:hypothetical protein PVK06_020167 [Gossypium arboreum]|uniref:Uncharacterized protein n=1 Tax=Gossypium arboreum TaxID=29729 RepID=A0ABR0PLX1_GOSAR|nr:hypothetical protein PVK06_020167 [Gossypium arboreum]
MVCDIEFPIQPLEANVCYWRIKDGHEVEYAIGNDFLMFTSYGHSYIFGTPLLEYSGLIKVAVHEGYQCNPDKRPWGLKLLLDSLKQQIEQRFKGKVDSSKPVMIQLCVHSMTPDKDFMIDILGGVFRKDVVIGGGFSGYGFKTSPTIRRILTDLALIEEA